MGPTLQAEGTSASPEEGAGPARSRNTTPLDQLWESSRQAAQAVPGEWGVLRPR